MNAITILALSFAGGVLLGAVFFGGLWITILNGMYSRFPALWFIVSYILRITIILAGFYYGSDGHWEQLVAMLLGFITVRFALVRSKQSSTQDTNSSQEEKGGQP